MISRFRDKLRSLFKRKQKSTLQAPKITKMVIRLARRRRSRVLFVLFFTWPSWLAFISAAIYAATSDPGSVSPGLWRFRVWGAAAVAFTIAFDLSEHPWRRWRRWARRNPA